MLPFVRAVCVACLLVAPTVSAQAPDPGRVGLTMTLPAGFTLEASIEENLPDVAFYQFLNREAGQIVAVEVHTYFSAEQRAAWLTGAWGERDLAHLAAVERVDAATFPLDAGAAFRIADAGRGVDGVALFGCDAERCYRVNVTAPAGAGAGTLAALLGGVRFRAPGPARGVSPR